MSDDTATTTKIDEPKDMESKIKEVDTAIEVNTDDKKLDLLKTAEEGHGSQIVKILEDHSYELDDVELKKILLKDEYKDLPVVVVSVAGTYRGGKSFLLNILLRYLTSTPSSQQDGSWLAEDSKPLTGFSWRGGSVRNTTGILLWSMPIVITLPSGDKVAVLLMDTQGTFDNESTVRDCSTIFGLSTLISSVQIYNISKNIKEDDMQHLQLFTEYGKLAQEKGTTKPFQSLLFLVRDWPYPWEFPYGAEGGESLLQSKIKVTEKTPQEIKELRKHLLSSFEKISAFLLPHPGFNVMNPKFNGAVRELDPEFRIQLIELVKLLFSPDKLMLKNMNGDKIKLGDLYTYFQTYMTLFNSEDVPNPTNIMQATVTAVLLNATNQAREMYIKGMDTECGSTQPSVPEADLKDLHSKYLSAACESFTAKKKMGPPEEATKYLEKLIKEINARLPQIQMNNKAKLEATLKNVMNVYEKNIQNISKGNALCLHPRDFLELHKEGVQTAIKIFDSNRKLISSQADVERLKLEQSFNERYVYWEENNDLNNKTAVIEVCSQYSRIMENKCSLEPPLREDDFKIEHENAKKLALDNFNTKRNRSHSYPEDVYTQYMIAEINLMFAQFNITNTSKYNAMAVAMFRKSLNKARQLYEKEMQLEVQTPQSMPTEDLEHLHRKYLEKAKATFSADVTMGTKEEFNVFLQELTQLEAQLPQYQQNNKSKLQTTIKQSEEAYQAAFYNISKDKPICLHPLDLEKVHQEGFKTAIKLFEGKRKIISSKTDEEKLKMEQNLKDHFEKLQWTNDINNKTLVIELHLQYSMFMNTKCSMEPPLHEDAFKHEHETTLKTALDDFNARRNKHSVYPDDVYKTSLKTGINTNFGLLNNINSSKFKSTVLTEIAQAADKTRQFYDKGMMEECGTGQASMPSEDLEVLHKKYLEKAKETFNSHIKLATGKETSKHIEQIIQELEGRLLMFQQYNSLKYRTTIENALNKYEEIVKKINNGKSVCVHPKDLQKVHDEGMTAAMEIYNANRKLISSTTDTGKTDLELLIKKKYNKLDITNNQNNTTMLKEIHTEYWKKMKIHSAHIPPYSDQDFKNQHEIALKSAVSDFDSKRNQLNIYKQDEYKEKLIKEISDSYQDFQNINTGRRIEKENIKEEQSRLTEQNRQLQSLQATATELQNAVEQIRRNIRQDKYNNEMVLNDYRNRVNDTKSRNREQLQNLSDRYNNALSSQSSDLSRLRQRVNDMIWRINNGYY